MEKIIVVTEGFPVLSETFILDQIVGYIDSGFDVEIWTSMTTKMEKVHASVIKYNLLQRVKVITLPQNIFLNLESWRDEFYRINNVSRLEDVGRIHIHFGTSFNRLSNLFKVNSEIFVAVSFHGYDATKFIKEAGPNCYDYLFNRADLITAPSYYLKNILVSYGCPESKVSIHRYGIDLSFFNNEYRSGEDGKINLLTVSRLVPKKGLEYSISALSKIKNLDNIHYKIIGEGPLQTDLIRLIKNLHLEKNVEIVPFMDKVGIVEALKNTDIFILTSVTAQNGDQEGLPVSLIEAHAMGLPVISTFHSGIPELVDSGKTGFLCEEKNAEQIAQKLEILVNNPALRRSFSLNARKRVESEFNIIDLNQKLLRYLGMQRRIRGVTFCVCIPTYNRAQFLSEAINSVLNQNYSDFQIIIVDDGSTDNTFEVVKSIKDDKIVYFKISQNSGRPAARNRCIQEATSEYIVWLDDDDKMMPGLLLKYDTILRNNPDVDVIYGDVQSFDNETGEKLAVYSANDYTKSNTKILENIISGSGITNNCVLVKKGLYEAVGYYDVDYLRAQDNEFWARIALKAKFYKAPGIVCEYRLHKTNVSSNKAIIDRSYESKTIRKILGNNHLKDIFPEFNFDSDTDKNKALLIVASGLYLFQDYYNALRIIRENITISSSDALRLYVMCLLKMGKILEAKDEAKRYRELFNSDEKTLNETLKLIQEFEKFNSIARKNIEQLDLSKLQLSIRRFIGQFGYTFDVSKEVGRLLTKAGELERAYEAMSMAVRMNPEDNDTYLQVYEIAKKLNRTQSLEAMRSRILTQIPLFSSKESFIPEFSIIIPTFNRPGELKNAIQSVLVQKYSSFEIIVVNDGGENVRALVNSFNDPRIQLVEHKINKGLAAARNTGILKAKGKFIGLLDDDDIFYPDHLQIAASHLNGSNRVIYTDAERFTYSKYKNRNVLVDKSVPYSMEYHPDKLLIGNIAPVNCFVFERELAIKAGLFNESLKVLEDWDFWTQLSRLSDFMHIKKVTCRVNWKNDGSTMTSSKAEEFVKTRESIYKQNESLISKIHNANEIIDEFNEIWKKDSIIGKPFVSIVVPLFNNLKYTKEFVKSVEKTEYPNSELIFTDNASTDGTVEYLKELQKKKKNISVIFNNENYGFPKAVNQAIKAASGSYVLIANNDIIVTDGWLERMIQVAESDNKIGIVGVVSNSVSGVQIDKNAKYNTIAEMHKYAKKVRKLNAGQIIEFPRVAFLCTLIKKEVVDAIGGLDERFSPGNFEDDDFCLRTEKAGFKTVIAKDVFIHHYGSKSFKADGEQKYAERLEINKKKFIDKWGYSIEEIWLEGKPANRRALQYPINSDEFIEQYERALIEIEDKEYTKAVKSLNNARNLFYHDNQNNIRMKDINMRLEELDQLLNKKVARNPKISIILLTWNRAVMLDRCLDSIFNNLYYKESAEVIVGNNGSTDNTAEILDKYKIDKIVNPGVNIAWDLYRPLFDSASGEYIIEIDDDVLELPKHFDKAFVEYFETYEDFGLLGLDVIQNEHTNGCKPDENQYVEIKRNGFIVQEGLVGGWCLGLRKDTYDKMGGLGSTSLNNIFFEDGILNNKVKGINLRTGIIKDVKCFHASGPYYSKLYGYLSRDIAKYKIVGMTNRVQLYYSQTLDAESSIVEMINYAEELVGKKEFNKAFEVLEKCEAALNAAPQKTQSLSNKVFKLKEDIYIILRQSDPQRVKNSYENNSNASRHSLSNKEEMLLLIKSEKLIEQNNLGEALELLEQIIKINPMNIDALNDLAVVSILAGDYESAADFIEKVVKIDPANDVAMENMNYLSRLIDEKMNQKENDTEISLPVNNTEVVKPSGRYGDMLSKAESFIEKNELASARKLLETILMMEEGNLDALNDLSVIEIMEKNYPAAVELLEKVIRLEPDNEVANENILFLQKELNNL